MKDKMLSGRLILTVICGLVFAYSSFARILTPEGVLGILTMVFVSYFQRNDRNGNKDNGGAK